ncbi:hypothetical protein LTR37_020400 [Vermiconidia calcicola]|uniref:Uncharacterized protein n=1 Tax=Vermiconidia calcicola TaxID=1690605 RepID=A0ACC3MBB5_9PEZI|nr:hypothetical protein LTR37_020400 [Vermiconidia calcicola]
MDLADIEAFCEGLIAEGDGRSAQTKPAQSNDLNAIQATSSKSFVPSAKLSIEEKPSIESDDTPKILFVAPVSSKRSFGRLKNALKAPTGSKRKRGRRSDFAQITTDLESDGAMSKKAKRKAKAHTKTTNEPMKTGELINLISDDAEVTTSTNPATQVLPDKANVQDERVQLRQRLVDLIETEAGTIAQIIGSKLFTEPVEPSTSSAPPKATLLKADPTLSTAINAQSSVRAKRTNQTDSYAGRNGNIESTSSRPVSRLPCSQGIVKSEGSSDIKDEDSDAIKTETSDGTKDNDFDIVKREGPEDTESDDSDVAKCEASHDIRAEMSTGRHEDMPSSPPITPALTLGLGTTQDHDSMSLTGNGDVNAIGDYHGDEEVECVGAQSDLPAAGDDADDEYSDGDEEPPDLPSISDILARPTPSKAALIRRVRSKAVPTRFAPPKHALPKVPPKDTVDLTSSSNDSENDRRELDALLAEPKARPWYDSQSDVAYTDHESVSNRTSSVSTHGISSESGDVVESEYDYLPQKTKPKKTVYDTDTDDEHTDEREDNKVRTIAAKNKTRKRKTVIDVDSQSDHTSESEDNEVPAVTGKKKTGKSKGKPVVIVKKKTGKTKWKPTNNWTKHRFLVEGMEVVAGVSKKCMLAMLQSKIVIYTTQLIVWQVLWILGAQMEPFASSSLDNLPRERLRTHFERLGCFPAFMEKGETHGIGRAAKSRKNCKFSTKPCLLKIIGLGVVCTSCGKHHADQGLDWIVILLIGCGILVGKTLALYVKKGMHISHRCGFNWCINPFHFWIEHLTVNEDRKKCHSRRKQGTQLQCKHSPPCILGPADSPRPRPTHRAYRAQLQRFADLEYDTCDNCEYTGTGPEVMFHVMKHHALEPEVERTKEEMGFNCIACGLYIRSRGTIDIHRKNILTGKKCTPAIPRGNITEIIEQGCTLLCGLDKLVDTTTAGVEED